MSSPTAPTSHRTNSAYPEPIIVAPAQEHKQTFIILHGRGSTASKFAPALLAHQNSDSQTLPKAFPHAKFIFPTAPYRRAMIYKRALTHQWFDCWHLAEPGKREDLQIEGLRETSAFIHGLLREESKLVGVGNVVLWGLSQGCAAALVAMLTWEGEALGAVVGMCGWLPFRRQLEEIVRGEQAGDVMGGDEEDVFEADTARPVGEGPVENAITWLREELEMPKGQTTMSFQQVPVFLGHGVEDDKVLVDLGSEAAHCLRSLGVNVHWTEYKGLGHWYSKDMLCDIKDFIQRQGKVQVDSP